MKNKLIKYVFFIFVFFMQSINANSPGKYVIIVIIDGSRYSETFGDTTYKYIPKMNQLSKNGVVIDTFINDGITVTKRGIPAIWSGSWAVPRDTVINGISTQYTTVPSVWEYYRKTFQTSSSDAVYFIKYLSSPWLQSYHKDYGINYWPYYSVAGSNDLDVWNIAKNYYQNNHPHLSVLYLADVDFYGHSGNWNSYVKSIKVADSIVGMLWNFVQGDSVYKDKTDLIVTNDHGRHLDGVSTGFTSHGDGCWGCRQILLLGIGPDIIKSGHQKVKYSIPDIVPTIGKILNFNSPLATGKEMNIIQINNMVQESIFPTSFNLDQNYPNPFNPLTVISIQLPMNSKVSLKIYDNLGKEIETLLNKELEAGKYSFNWNGTKYSSGVYYFELIAGRFRATRKMIIIK